MQHFRLPTRLPQRVIIGLVNLAALFVFVAVELCFSYFAFPTPWAMLLVAAAGALFRLGEVLLSHRRPMADPRRVQGTASLSILFGLALPFVLAAATRQFHTHYFGLLILPVLEGALYFSFLTTLGIAGLASFSAFLWVFYAAHFKSPFQLGELLEATTVSLLLFTVASLIWALLDLLGKREAELNDRLGDLEQARERLSEEEKLAAVGRLASAVAHEIRNPVAIIRSAVEASTSSELEHAEREAMSGIALAEARRLERLTTDFLSYAQPGNLPFSEVDVYTLLGYLASIARAQARGKQVEISLVIGDGCSLYGNEDQLQQAILNLLRNAIDASPAGLPVLIQCESGAGCITIAIENAGHPIPSEAAPKIFEPFFTAKSGGTGLGLSIARKIAEAHGGGLTLAQNSDNRVRFEMTLPAKPELSSSAGRTGG